ncbi:MAG: WecB/TagA/CpsF family glycosyltransferase [Ignavibacteriaceae bacterium]|nr:WecB/TagA/CpsF family glycosyltransferase [Ignavibacteriaceae bacterium]MCU0413478.1 WecB/TagA/CpsF family glycosyltransferase [Ignavibacteriaceae bacterium]
MSSPEAVTEKVFDSVKQNKSLLLTYFNQHCFNIYYEDDAYRNLIEQKFNAYQADLGVYFAAKFLNHSDPKRLESTAINESILKQVIAKNIPVVIIGGSFEETFVSKEAKKRGINLLNYKNGFFEEPEVESIITQLNSINANIIFVGMGVPKQEIFAEKLSKSLKNKVIICVGIFFEYYFGTTKRAPVFIQKIGLEWMFRLLTEPKRLWRRYLIGIPEFIFRVIKLKSGSKVT